MENKSKMSSLSEKNEYEKIINDYDNLFGFDIGSMNVSSLAIKNKTNFVNGELIIKKR